mgnify:CR=1 FL=1
MARRKTRQELDALARKYAGCRRLSYARSTGSLTGIYDAEAQALDGGDDRWVVTCEDHGSILSAHNLATARWMATEPETWCEDCQET